MEAYVEQLIIFDTWKMVCILDDTESKIWCIDDISEDRPC